MDEFHGNKDEQKKPDSKDNTEYDSFFFFFFLVAPHSMQDLRSATRDRTRAPCCGSAGPQPLDGQGSPVYESFYTKIQLM